MDHIHTISWGSFAFWLILLVGLWWAYTRIAFVKDIVSKYTKLDTYQFTLILIIIIVLLFVFVHPITHGLLVILSLFLFWNFTRGTDIKANIFSFNKKYSEEPVETRKKYEFLLSSSKEIDLVNERKNLERNIFSCPYIVKDNAPQINYDTFGYNVSLYLSSEKYVSSVIQYMTHSGFNIKLINK